MLDNFRNNALTEDVHHRKCLQRPKKNWLISKIGQNLFKIVTQGLTLAISFLYTDDPSVQLWNKFGKECKYIKTQYIF